MNKINFQNNVTKANADTFNTLQDNVEDAIGVVNTKIDTKGITTSGSNENGTYIKFDDGTLVCWGNRTFNNVACTVAWGSLYESTTEVDLGTYPYAFYSRPRVSVQCTSGSGLVTVFLEQIRISDANPEKIGTVYVCRPQSTPSVNFGVDFIAIGRWKE